MSMVLLALEFLKLNLLLFGNQSILPNLLLSIPISWLKQPQKIRIQK